jgi:hypothetical protein
MSSPNRYMYHLTSLQRLSLRYDDFLRTLFRPFDRPYRSSLCHSNRAERENS